MTIAITGASGHIGGNLVRSLIERGRSCRALVYKDSRALDGLDVQLVRGDVQDRESLLSAFDKVETVFHLAARISIESEKDPLLRRVNVDGTQNVVDACRTRGVKKLVHFSSIHALVQDPCDVPLDENRPLAQGAGHFAYDRSKARSIEIVRQAAADGLDAVILCPTAVIGPYDFKPSRMGELLLEFFQYRRKVLVNGGFDWVDVRDVIEGALLAEQRGRAGEMYLLSGYWRSIRDLAWMAARVAGVRAPRWVAPLTLARMSVPFAQTYAKLTRTRPLVTAQSMDVLRSNRQIRREKAERELGYSPRPIEQTVADTWEWFKRTGSVKAP